MAFYVVHKTDLKNGSVRLIEAPNQAAALRFCAQSEYSVRAASQQDLVSLLSTDKIEVERVSNDARVD